jgi:hypothetical protein
LFESAAEPALEPKYSELTLVAGSDASKDNHVMVAKPCVAAAGSEPGLDRQVRQLVCTLESLRRRKRQLSYATFPFSFRRRDSGFPD